LVLLSLSSRFLVTVLGIVAFLFSGLVMRWVDVLFFSACFGFSSGLEQLGAQWSNYGVPAGCNAVSIAATFESFFPFLFLCPAAGW